jgi:hypothetical protein
MAEAVINLRCERYGVVMTPLEVYVKQNSSCSAGEVSSRVTEAHLSLLQTLLALFRINTTYQSWLIQIFPSNILASV